jgi:hypothetical protein
MMGGLVLYLSWHPASPFNLKGGSADSSSDSNNTTHNTPASDVINGIGPVGPVGPSGPVSYSYPDQENYTVI